MPLIHLRDLKIGMCLAESVSTRDGIILYNSGIFITNMHQIEKIKDAGIKYVNIDIKRSLVNYQPQHIQSNQQKQFLKEVRNPEKLIKSLKQELRVAKEFYAESEKVVENVMHDLRMGKNLNKEDVQIAVEQILESVMANHQALLSMANLRKYDEYTFKHSVNVCVITLSFAKQVIKDEKTLHLIGEGALLHDIGKSKISPHIINKKTKLTDEEFEIVKKHPAYGKRICLEQNIDNKIILESVYHHHESFDGTGYPDNLSNKSIDKFAAMVSISDFYDALTTVRSYKDAFSPAEATALIYRQASKKFDQRIVNLFIKTVGIYPVGSLVRLHSMRLAVVVAFSQYNLLYPIVKVITDSEGNLLPVTETLSLFESDDFIEDISVQLSKDFSLDRIL